MDNKNYIEEINKTTNELVSILNESEIKYGDWKAILLTFSVSIMLTRGEVDVSLNILGHALLEANVIDADEEVYNECKKSIKNILGRTKTNSKKE